MNTIPTSFFLGENPALYCRLHGLQGNSAALVVPPLFGELVQSHRALVTLCNRLELLGMPAMFFDLTGTGDSAGDLDDASVSRWEEDIARTVEELTTRTQAREIVLISCRMSATIALKIAALDPMISRLVLWQPVAHGDAYLKELRSVHAANTTLYTTQIEHPDPDLIDLIGFSVPRRLATELSKVSMAPYALRPDQSALCLGATMDDVSCLARHGARVETDTFDTLRGWLDPSEGIYDVIVPPDALDRTVKWLGGHDN